MYQQYFGLRGLPFSIAPDPHYLYLSSQHREALAHLLYGVGEGGGFVLLTGEVGTGKTTVCRCLLQQLPEKTEVAVIVNPRQSPIELVASICDELGADGSDGPDTIKFHTDRLTRHLLESHRRGFRTILVIDEAQNLGVDVLEQIRLLTNLETDERKLLQLIILGQPELNELLARRELRQFAQRITARYHLGTLDLRDTRAYINHRLAVAGMYQELFPAWAVRRLHAASGGIPRLLNVLCDRVLLGVYGESAVRIERRHVAGAIREIMQPALGAARRRRWWPWAGLAAVLLLAGGAHQAWKRFDAAAGVTGVVEAGTKRSAPPERPVHAAVVPAPADYPAALVTRLNERLDEIEHTPLSAVEITAALQAAINPVAEASAMNIQAVLLSAAPVVTVTDRRHEFSATLEARVESFRRRAGLGSGGGVDEALVVALHAGTGR